jgi:hypothetical protein
MDKAEIRKSGYQGALLLIIDYFIHLCALESLWLLWLFAVHPVR